MEEAGIGRRGRAREEGYSFSLRTVVPGRGDCRAHDSHQGSGCGLGRSDQEPENPGQEVPMCLRLDRQLWGKQGSGPCNRLSGW